MGCWQSWLRLLQYYDPQAEYLSGVYNMYPPKQGTVLATGHRVYAPEALMCDVIVVFSNNVEQFVRLYVKKHARPEKVIDIGDVIFGRLPLQKIIHEEKMNLSAARQEKICGLVIMYQPSSQNFSYAKQYADELDHLVLKAAGVPFCLHTSYIAQSGMLQRIRSIRAIGGYDRNLFIDSVDYDFVVRCMPQGYQTLRLNDCCLYHQIDDTDSKDINVKGHIYHTNKYGPLRYYYQYRNALYCKDKFHGSAYEFIWDEVLDGLDRAMMLEKQADKITSMVKRAKLDFAAHVMGKYRARRNAACI